MSAYFSATETAFNSFNKIRVKNLAEKGNRRAARALELDENYDTLISTILIGNNIVNILAASLATLYFTDLLKEGSAAQFATTISTAVMTILVLTFGEIAPKTIAKQTPDKFVLFSTPIISALVIILKPLSFIFKQLQMLHISMAAAIPHHAQDETIFLIPQS